MKKLILFIWLMFLVTSTSFAQSPEKIADIDLGSKFTDYPKVAWLKGEPVSHFDKDKIYIVDLWATWCVPCIAAMPHLKELNDEFKDKNVVFIAQDVMEDSQAKVEQFVRQNSNMQNLRVAFGGNKGSDFDKRWVQAAGVMSIPQTFVIQNNMLVWQTHPGRLNKEVIQLLINGKFTIEAAEKISEKN